VSGEVSVRPALPEDAAGLARVRVDYAAYHASLDPEIFREVDPDEVRSALGERPALSGDEVLVAEAEGEVVGFVELRLERPAGPANIHQPVVYGYVEDVAVLAEHRGRGFGRALMLAAEDWARANGAAAMLLDTHPRNLAALSFYREALGYSTTGLTMLKRLA
jgi:ribosomal protein S18 acetylase RimI-like enzyme